TGWSARQQSGTTCRWRERTGLTSEGFFLQLSVRKIESLSAMLRIAMIAHDGKKADMVSFLLNHKELFRHAELYATATTGSFLEKAGFKVVKLLSGPY